MYQKGIRCGVIGGRWIWDAGLTRQSFLEGVRESFGVGRD